MKLTQHTTHKEIVQFMAVATKAAPTQKTETKEEPIVVADVALGKILKTYTGKEAETQSYWLKIVEYCSKNRTSRKTLIATLIEYRNVQKNTASVEATYILKGAAAENAALLQQALDGEITTREFRKATMGASKTDEEGNVVVDYEKRIRTKLRAAADYAVENVEISIKEFRQMAGEAFEKAVAKQEKLETTEEAPEEAETEGAEEEGELEE